MSSEAAGGHVWEEDETVGEAICQRCDLREYGYTDQECPGVPTRWDDGDPAQPIGFGLRSFMHEAMCPKCASTGVRTVYHPTIILSLGSNGQHPCAAWMQAGILSSSVGQHLCVRCARCGYGWPTKTADEIFVEGLEDDREQEPQ